MITWCQKSLWEIGNHLRLTFYDTGHNIRKFFMSSLCSNYSSQRQRFTSLYHFLLFICLLIEWSCVNLVADSSVMILASQRVCCGYVVGNIKKKWNRSPVTLTGTEGNLVVSVDLLKCLLLLDCVIPASSCRTALFLPLPPMKTFCCSIHFQPEMILRQQPIFFVMFPTKGLSIVSHAVVDKRRCCVGLQHPGDPWKIRKATGSLLVWTF